MATYRQVVVQLTDQFTGDPPVPVWDDASHPPVEKVVEGAALSTVLEGLPGGVFVALRAATVDVYGNQSEWSDYITTTTTRDAIAPSTPGGLVATGGFRGATAAWSRSGDLDVDYYQLEWSTDPTFAEGSTSALKTKATAVWVTGLTPESNPGDADVVYYFRVRTVDTSANEGALSGRFAGTAEESNDLITADTHGLVAGDVVLFEDLVGGTGLTTGTVYYVIASGLTANDFRVSATLGGSQVNITVDYSSLTVVHDATAVATQVGTADIAANTVTAEHITTSGLTADVIKAGTLRLTPAGGSLTGALAIEVYTADGILVGSWSPSGGLVVKNEADTSDYAHLDDGYLRFYRDNILTAEIGPDGILASSITYGTQPGGQNLVKNGSFEIGPYSASLDATVTFTDTTTWKAADGTHGRVTALVNLTEGTTLEPTSVAF